MKLILVRHGERTYGREDDELTDNGKEQIRYLALRLKEENIRTIYTNNLTRSKQTANILAEALGANIIYDSNLNELAKYLFFNDSLEIENDIKELNTKILNFVDELKMRNNDVILATNAGINRAIIGALLNIPLKNTIAFNQNYAAVTELKYITKDDKSFWRLNLLNCKKHLPQDIMS